MLSNSSSIEHNVWIRKNKKNSILMNFQKQIKRNKLWLWSVHAYSLRSGFVQMTSFFFIPFEFSTYNILVKYLLLSKRIYLYWLILFWKCQHLVGQCLLIKLIHNRLRIFYRINDCNFIDFFDDFHNIQIIARNFPSIKNSFNLTQLNHPIVFLTSNILNHFCVDA